MTQRKRQTRHAPRRRTARRTLWQRVNKAYVLCAAACLMTVTHYFLYGYW